MSFSKKPPDDPMALAPLFGPPLESTFDEQKTEGKENKIKKGGGCFLLLVFSMKF